MADKNFTITNRRGIEVPVPEWLYNINNIKGVVVKLPTYELAHIIVPLNSAAQDKVLEALPPRSVSDEFVQTETTQSGIEVKMKVYVCFFPRLSVVAEGCSKRVFYKPKEKAGGALL